MTSKPKIFNDPIYGLLEIPNGILFKLIEHPFFQRLRRIKQLGLSDYVYPGALHTRFHHALGALHIMGKAVNVLRSKGNEISEAEEEAVKIAILLHDIGHGPFSHALENILLPMHHEDISLKIMERLNIEFDHKLDLAISIFQGKYKKQFLYQLISGQLDMDRMDYLKRDSFFTGVHEGVIGHERIIQMLDVVNDKLVLEEKAIYSIEKFLIARRLMYWQVYLHKTVLAAEQLLIRVIKTAKEVFKKDPNLPCSKTLRYFFERSTEEDFNKPNETIEHFVKLDDFDIISGIKEWVNHDDAILAFLSRSILNRKLFRIELGSKPIEDKKVEKIRKKLGLVFDNQRIMDSLIFTGVETNTPYSTTTDEIKILLKDGSVKPLSEISDYGLEDKIITKYYLCYPKNIS